MVYAADSDPLGVREDFPILRTEVRGRPIAYLDNAATTQKPRRVLEAVDRYYCNHNANVHRGVHYLSELATEAYELARGTVRQFLGASHNHEVIFVRGCTEAINLVAATFGRNGVAKDNNVVISWMEHHSNIVPWQLAAKQTGAELRVIPISDRGELDLIALDRLVTHRTALVSLVYVSNSLGTLNPVKDVIALAHSRGVPVLLDAAQAMAHMTIDVRNLGCDFLAFSGHKMYAPMGIGVLYGRSDLLNAMPPYQGGGDMIRSVSFRETTYNVPPHKFEAGTPNVGGAVGLAAAIDYICGVGLERIGVHESQLLAYATEQLARVPGLRIIGTAKEKVGSVSFVIEGIHPHDIGTILDEQGIATRVGHHCTQPVMERFDVPATTRVSLGLYNTSGEIDRVVAGVRAAQVLLGKRMPS